MILSASVVVLVLEEIFLALALILLPNNPQGTCISWNSFKSIVPCKDSKVTLYLIVSKLENHDLASQ
jgi:hypothetical protein